MNTKLLLLAATASLAAACSHEKTETTTTVETPAGTETTTVTVDTAAYRSDADALATRVANDLKITDPAVITRVQTVYYTRGRALRTYDTQYAADTTGRYASLKAANDAATRDLKAVLSDAQYNTYTSGQGAYYNGPYTVVVATPGARPARSLEARVGGGSTVTKMERDDDGDKKTKFENGAKVKRDDDGSIKIKRADGTKVKIDEDGNRTVKKPLFK